MNTRRKLLLFGKRGGPFDPDAAAYIARVETADGQSLEPAVKTAINDFVVGVKADGDWPALKASCILAGAQTLNGALEPLTGVAPTNFNFVGTDYDRKTGLKGNGNTKYLDSNRAGSADPRNNVHIAAYKTLNHDSTLSGRFGAYVGCGETGTGATQIMAAGGSDENLPEACRMRSATINTYLSSVPPPLGFVGATRNISGSYLFRTGGSTQTISEASEVPPVDNYYVFARNDGAGTPQGFSNGRQAFYSNGEDINLANLDARVSAFISALNTAI